MHRALALLREAIEAFHRGDAAAELERARDPSADSEPRSVGSALRLLSNEGADALAETRERGELPDDELEWLGRQRAALRIMVVRSRLERTARKRLSEIETPTGGHLALGEELSRIALTADLRSREETCRSLESVVRPLAELRASAHSRLESLAYVDIPREQPKPDPDAPAAPAAEPKPVSSFLIVSAFDSDVLSPPLRDLQPLEWLTHARTFLDKTDAAAEDAVRFLVRNVHARSSTGAVPWHTLLSALRAYELDSEIGRQERWQRTALWLRKLGFEEAMSARLRAEVDHAAVLPIGRTLRLDVPRDVRLAQTPHNFGVVSDLCAAEAVARGLAQSLVHFALPPELRYPLGATVAGSIGMLGMLAWCDPEQLTRLQSMTTIQTERIGRISRTTVLLWTRLCASLALMPACDAEQPEARLEQLCEAVGRALSARIEPGVAGVLVMDRILARDRALEALSGLAAASALRERLNADWYRNPRTEDLLTGLAQRGNRLSLEAMCTELGCSVGDAAARALELVS